MRNLVEGEYTKDGLIFCSVCNEPKQMRLHLRHGTTVVEPGCACVQKRIREEREAERQLQIEKNIRGCYLDFSEEQKQNYSRLLDELTESEYTHKARAYVQKFEQFEKDGIGLLLVGGVGTGKSTLASAIANELLRQGRTVKFTNFSHIYDRLDTLKGVERLDYVNKLARYSLLVLDDLGIERETPTMQEIVYKVINARYESGRPMIVTTNISAEEFKKPSDTAKKRIYDRILERCHPVKMEGASIRRRKIRDEFERIELELRATP